LTICFHTILFKEQRDADFLAPPRAEQGLSNGCAVSGKERCGPIAVLAAADFTGAYCH
jgi:hypothetical protein